MCVCVCVCVCLRVCACVCVCVCVCECVFTLDDQKYPHCLKESLRQLQQIFEFSQHFVV